MEESVSSSAPRRLTLRSALVMLAAGSGVGFLTGLFGVGGGFVTVPILTLLLGFNMAQAIGTSLVVVVVNSSAALLARLTAAGADVDWAVAAAFTVAALVGARLGAAVAGRLEPERTLRVFASGLVVLALYTAGTAMLSLRQTG
jgi:uncharacterized membrane protein YfcA